MPSGFDNEQQATAMPLAPTLMELDADARLGLEQASQLGFRHVQLSATQPGVRPRELDQSGRRGLLQTMRRLELEPAGLDLWIPPAHFLDPLRLDRAMGAVAAAIELAADLGRVPLSLALPSPGRAVPVQRESGPSKHDEIAEVAAAIAQCGQHHGVALADHAMPDADREGIGFGMDPAAWLAQDEDAGAAILRTGDRVVSVRLCDLLNNGMRGPIGEARQGRLDAQAYKIAVSVAGYRRPIVLDARQWTDPIGGMQQTATTWAQLV